MSTVKNFIEDFKAKKIVNNKINEHAVEDYIRETLQVKGYIPFTEKRELCTSVIEGSCGRENGLVTVDSVSRYMLFTIAVITKYTNIEFNTDEELDAFGEYDMLCESGLLDIILDVVGPEYVKCNNMLNMMLEDVISNNNTSEAVIGNVLEKISGKISDFIDVLSDKVEEMDLDLSQVDIEQFKPLFEKLGGLIE